MPKIKKNLFSVGTCTGKDYRVEFDETTVKVKRKNAVHAIGVRQTNAIYRMLFRVMLPQSSVKANIAAFDLKVWHERLGHIGDRALVEMVKNGLVDGVKIKKGEKFFCEPCQLGKSHRLPFKKERENRNTKPGELIHTDVCRKIHVESLGGANYYVTFIDDASNFCYVYFIKHKDDVLEKFKIF